MADAKISTKLKNRKKSALKAARVAGRRRVINIRRTRAMKEAVKEAMQLIAGKKGKEAVKLLPSVFQAIDKAIKTGVIKMNTGARIKSRIARSLKAVV